MLFLNLFSKLYWVLWRIRKQRTACELAIMPICVLWLKSRLSELPRIAVNLSNDLSGGLFWVNFQQLKST